VRLAAAAAEAVSGRGRRRSMPGKLAADAVVRLPGTHKKNP